MDLMELAKAALMACPATVTAAISPAPKPASRKICQDIPMRKAKSSSHWLIPYQESGTAIKKPNKTNFIKSLPSKVTILKVIAPMTFRMPISLVRCSVSKVVKPNNPKMEINTAKPAKKVKMVLTLASASYCALNPSSTNKGSNG